MSYEIKPYVVFDYKCDQKNINEIHTLFLRWLFKERAIGENDLDLLGFFMHLRRLRKFDQYRYLQDGFLASKKNGGGSILSFLNANSIQGSTLDHIDWAERLRMTFLMSVDEYLYAQFFVDSNTLNSVYKADFWVNKRKYTPLDYQKFMFNLSDKYLTFNDPLKNKMQKTKAELEFLRFIYTL